MSDNNNKVQLDWKTITKYALILFVITAICVALLALTNLITAPVIAQRNALANTAAQQEVLPGATEFKELDNIDAIKSKVGEGSDIIDSVYVGLKDGKEIGFAVKTMPNGFAGSIEMLTGIGVDGKITGLSILTQSETAGLGAKAPLPAFKDQYVGLDANKAVEVVKGKTPEGNQIQAITGATITSKAVTLGVNTAEKAAEAAKELQK